MRKILFILPLFLMSQTMTIYKDNFALVKEPVVWNVSSGMSEISYSKFPLSLVGDSPFLMVENGTIHSQRFNNDVFKGDNYFREKIGSEVVVKVQNDDEHEGTLIEFTGSSLTLQTRKEIKTLSRNRVDYIYTRDSETVPRLTSELTFDIYFKKGGKVQGELVYLTGGFDWNVVYRLVLNGEKGDLTSQAIISNTSNVDFSNFTLKLVEGNLKKKNIRPQPMYRNMRSGAMAMDAEVPTPTEKSLGDFHIYSLPEKINLVKNQSVMVQLYEPKKVDLTKTYVFKNSERQKRETPLQIEIKMANTKKNGLNIPLPQGKISLYVQENNQSLEYAGEDNFSQIPKGETATISGGRAFDVIGKRTILDYDRKRKSEEATIRLVVKNKKEETANIRLEEQIHGDWVIRNPSENYIKKDASTIYFLLSLKAGGTKTVTFTYRKEWN